MTELDLASAAAVIRSDFLGLVEVRNRTIVWANPAFHRIFGYDDGELINQPTRLFFADEASHEAFGREVSAVVLAGGVYSGETQQRRKDGSLGWFRFNVSLRHGQSDVAVGAVVDVTEQRRATQRLENQAEILANIADGVSLVAGDGRLLFTNAALDAMLGYGPGELVGRNVAVLEEESPSGQRSPTLLERLSAAQDWQGDLPTRRKDGSTFWTNIKISSHQLQSVGRVWLIVQRDVTERRRAEREQLRLNRALRLLNECEKALAGAEDEQQLLVDICRLFVETGGYLMAWVGVPLDDPEKSVQPVAQWGDTHGYLENVRISWDENKDTGLGPAGVAIRSRTTQVNQNTLTTYRVAHWRERARRSGLQASIAIPLLCRQLLFGILSFYAAEPDAFGAEEVKLLEEVAGNIAFGIQALRTRSQKDAAEAASRAKSAFLANMSHEIRTPLNAIMGMARMIRWEPLSPKQSDRLDVLEASGSHLVGVIDAILEIAKIEAGKLALEEEPVRIEDLLKAAVSMVQDQLEAKRLTLATRLEAMPGNLLGDSTALRQALLNYLINAVKFTRQGGVTIGVRVLEERESDALLRFEVVDTGIGIAADVLPRLFTVFEQADNSVTRPYGGTGLGLAITKRLAQLMGGDAGAESTPGAGSRFWFSARLKKGPPGAQRETLRSAEEVQALLKGRWLGARVLLAEDDAINREIAIAQLENVGLCVDAAEDGAAAVAMAGEARYDLILMDVQMPKIDGLEATHRIRQLPNGAEIPILAITANAFAEDRARCLAAGMNDFVGKPVRVESLYATLLKWLEVSSLR